MVERTDEGPIRFGTGGWRGIVGDEVTPRRLAAVVHGVGRSLLDAGGSREILLAYDRRAGSEEHARLAVGCLAQLGARPLLCEEVCPTPAVTHRLAMGGLAGAVVFTASHNPPEYNGLKVFDSRGRCIGGEGALRIERLAQEALASEMEPPHVAEAGSLPDLISEYRAAVTTQIDVGALRAAELCVHYDALHGAGAGVLDTILAAAGVRVRAHRTEADPSFGGGAPDPTPERLGELAHRVASEGARCVLGVATDGDADRFAIVDERGRVLTATQALALLIDHLGQTGRLGRGVAISLATGSLVERVAARWGGVVRRHAMGFRHLSERLASGAADVAGDESGGFALGLLSPDKDGILASCLMAERLAVRAEPVGAAIAKLERELGSSACGRSAVPADPASCDALAKLTSDTPARVDGACVRSVDQRAGLRLVLDDGFLMLRRSGTEPLIRVYAEAPTATDLQRRLARGRGLLAGD